MSGFGKNLNFSKISSFARVIDPRYPTNLAILVISTLCGGGLLIFNLVEGNEIFPAITIAFSFAVSVFLTWAIAREIDPEHELAAFAGLILVIPGFLLLGFPDLIMVLTMLLLLRMVIRTTGLQPKLLDSLTIIALGSFLVLRGDWIFGFFCAAAFFLDSRLNEPLRRNLLFTGIMTALAVIILLIWRPTISQVGREYGQLIFVIGAILLFTPLVRASRNVDVVCDYQPQKLNPTRLQTGQVFAISTAAITWVVAGTTGITYLLPLWSSIIGLSIAYLFSKLVQKIGGTS